MNSGTRTHISHPSMPSFSTPQNLPHLPSHLPQPLSADEYAASFSRSFYPLPNPRRCKSRQRSRRRRSRQLTTARTYRAISWNKQKGSISFTAPAPTVVGSMISLELVSSPVSTALVRTSSSSTSCCPLSRLAICSGIA